MRYFAENERRTRLLTLLRDLPAAQQPRWPDSSPIKEVQLILDRSKALISWEEVNQLSLDLRKIATGKAIILQVGDCAEDPRHSGQSIINDKLDFMDGLGKALKASDGRPTIKVGRIAGQYTKPRSQNTEKVNGINLPVYRGPMVNDPSPTYQSRSSNPEKMLQCHFAAQECLTSMQLHKLRSYHDRIWTSHEALLLDYETCAIRGTPDGKQFYLSSTHWPWIGDRTRQLNGAHVHLMSCIANPISCKIGPDTTSEQVLKLCEILNPDRCPGRLTLIVRFGIDKICQLKELVTIVQRAEHPVIWLSDPMHGNTVNTSEKLKTRNFEDILGEALRSKEIIKLNGGIAGGLHIEATHEQIYECSNEGCEAQSGTKYQTLCDPRLNQQQAYRLVSLWGAH
ncbi:3-deoxy-7-phosphoheptulonate synthase [Serratia fonticola]|uniref:3-deoxy-7-phosphoheptulonate synthase n=1 Tax=Serratia fonticola TaxID=47917 RepID=UPI003BB662D5